MGKKKFFCQWVHLFFNCSNHSETTPNGFGLQLWELLCLFKCGVTKFEPTENFEVSRTRHHVGTRMPKKSTIFLPKLDLPCWVREIPKFSVGSNLTITHLNKYKSSQSTTPNSFWVVFEWLEQLKILKKNFHFFFFFGNQASEM